jgi:hypothetical protein
MYTEDSQSIKFEYIELQEILFYNYKINVVFQDDVYKNGNILEPECILSHSV